MALSYCSVYVNVGQWSVCERKTKGAEAQRRGIHWGKYCRSLLMYHESAKSHKPQLFIVLKKKQHVNWMVSTRHTSWSTFSSRCDHSKDANINVFTMGYGNTLAATSYPHCAQRQRDCSQKGGEPEGLVELDSGGEEEEYGGLGTWLPAVTRGLWKVLRCDPAPPAAASWAYAAPAGPPPWCHWQPPLQSEGLPGTDATPLSHPTHTNIWICNGQCTHKQIYKRQKLLVILNHISETQAGCKCPKKATKNKEFIPRHWKL